MNMGGPNRTNRTNLYTIDFARLEALEAAERKLRKDKPKASILERKVHPWSKKRSTKGTPVDDISLDGLLGEP